VIHVVAERLDDLSPLLKRLAEETGCVQALANCDEVRRPIPERRLPPAAQNRAGAEVCAQACDQGRDQAPAEEFTGAAAPDPAEIVRTVMPKGRNFH